jgi:hypothetical protein
MFPPPSTQNQFWWEVSYNQICSLSFDLIEFHTLLWEWPTITIHKWEAIISWKVEDVVIK